MKSTQSTIWMKFVESVVVPLLPRKRANLMQCQEDELWNTYFEDAESKIEVKNPGWRSNVSKEGFAEMCEAAGLQVAAQKEIPWSQTVDCATVFNKPA